MPLLSLFTLTVDCFQCRESTELRGHGESIDQLCWDPSNPELLATASGDRTVRLWDARAGKQLQSISTSGENINIAWSPCGRYIAVGNRENSLSFIDTRAMAGSEAKARVVKRKKFQYEVNEFAWTSNGSYLFISMTTSPDHGSVEVMKFSDAAGGIDMAESVASITAHLSNIFCLKFDPTGRLFATGGADAMVCLWDTEELACVRGIDRLENPVRALSFSGCGRFLASAAEDPFIDIVSTVFSIFAGCVPIFSCELLIIIINLFRLM